MLFSLFYLLVCAFLRDYSVVGDLMYTKQAALSVSYFHLKMIGHLSEGGYC